MTTPTFDVPKVKWSYMDHWRSQGPAGPIDQWQSRLAMTRFLRQVAAVGFDAIDTFDFRFWQILEQYGSVANYQEFVQEQGLERIVNTFHGVYYTPERYAPEVPATHDTILEDFKITMDRWSGIQLDNIIVMPGSRYFDEVGVSDDGLKHAAEVWARSARSRRSTASTSPATTSSTAASARARR